MSVAVVAAPPPPPPLQPPQPLSAGGRARRLRAWLQPQVSIGVREQRDQAVLLLAVAVAVVPHFDHVPLWAIAVIGALWIWRAWLAQTMQPAPGRALVVALLVLLTGAVWITDGTLWGREASVHFLLVLVGLKILEMRARRDVFVIVFLCLFVLETQFLFDQGPLTALITLAAVGLLFFVLLSVSLPEGDVSLRGKVRYLGRVFLMALPLTLTLFFLFPRLSAPSWSLGGGDREATTGLSDSMTPGSIRNLMQSDAIALRAKFDGAIPPQRELYWRGPVFGQFDGRTWRALDPAHGLAFEAPQVRYDPRSRVDYTVTLEPTQRAELIALEFAAVVDGVRTEHGRLTATLELRSLAPVISRRLYRVRSYTSFSAEAGADAAVLGDWLQLPPQSNPRARQWANDLRGHLEAQAARAAPGGSVEQQLVAEVLAHFRREPFRYTLHPPATPGENAIDDFFFDTHAGYCEHYASAFVFLMRAAGVPARVVTGYQGGEVNPVDGFLAVRQSDAHAWAEVWLAGQGWTRVDPTAAVAPDRVEQAGHEALDSDAGGPRATRPWMRKWRLNREALENAWNQWFLSYSVERQRALVVWMGLRPNAQNIAIVGAGAFCLLLGIMAFFSLRRASARDPLAESVFEIRRKLAAAGMPVPVTMGLRDMEAFLQGRLEPSTQARAAAILRDLCVARYAPPDANPRAAGARVRALRARVRRWRPQRLRA